MDKINKQTGTIQERAAQSPSGGEHAFAWIFCLFYLSIMGAVIGVLVGYFLGGLGDARWLLPFAVVGLLPHATKAVAETLAATRSKPPLRRLGRILGRIHS
jgi:cation transporter-like permease